MGLVGLEAPEAVEAIKTLHLCKLVVSSIVLEATRSF